MTPAPNLVPALTPDLIAAYAHCRAIAKREAKNFYYSFRVLPRHKSDAMCAVYAFMRRADDLADDESKSLPQRRAEMAAWLDSWRFARTHTATQDPVFLALTDTQRRFHISDALLEDLVRGTTLDLAEQQPGVSTVPVTTELDEAPSTEGFQVHDTFADLYRYCYLVASVVGLVSIKVFGYTDPAAEKLAEETGIAFQLTNILRDVGEDVARNRVYLPQDDMRAHGLTPFDVVAAAQGYDDGTLGNRSIQPLLAQEGARAEVYYAAAQQLLPLIDPDARAALWVMVTIYHELLQQITAANYPVFGRRIRVSTPRKLLLLAQGFLMARRLKASA